MAHNKTAKKEENMTDEKRTNIGGNNPPEDAKIIALPCAEELEKIYEKAAEEIKNKAQGILNTCKRIPEEIKDDETYEKVVAVIASIRTIDADRDKQRKVAKDPYLKASTEVDRIFKLQTEKSFLSKDMEKAIKDLTKKLSEFDTLKYQKEKEANLLAAKELEKKAAQDGIDLDIKDAETKLSSVQSKHGGTGVRTVKKTWTVTDESKIPQSLFSLDKTKVDKMIEDGAQTIPGIKITEEVVTSVRR